MSIYSTLVDKNRKKIMYELLFEKDGNGRTPISYAVKPNDWPKESLFKILHIGAGMSSEDLSLLPPEVLEEFLDKQCVKRVDERTYKFNFSFLHVNILFIKFELSMFE